VRPRNESPHQNGRSKGSLGIGWQGVEREFYEWDNDGICNKISDYLAKKGTLAECW
jgi:hypothetical protein